MVLREYFTTIFWRETPTRIRGEECMYLEADAKLKDIVNEFIEDWNEGERRTFEVDYQKLGLNHRPTEEELDHLGCEIAYITSIELVEDGMLLIEIDECVLKATYEAQLQDWVEESDLKQFGRYESCGWI